jgi:hypothetical protein
MIKATPYSELWYNEHLLYIHICVNNSYTINCSYIFPEVQSIVHFGSWSELTSIIHMRSTLFPRFLTRAYYPLFVTYLHGRFNGQHFCFILLRSRFRAHCLDRLICLTCSRSSSDENYDGNLSGLWLLPFISSILHHSHWIILCYTTHEIDKISCNKLINDIYLQIYLFIY